MGEEVLTVWQRFHRETEALAIWPRLQREQETQLIRAAIRLAHEPPKSYRIHGDELRRALRI